MRQVPWWGWALGAGAAGAAIVWLARSSPSAPADTQGGTRNPDALARRRAQMMPYLREAAARHGLPLAWLLAFAHKESQFQNLRSKLGARDDVRGGAFGPLQMTSETARRMGFLPSASHPERGRAILADPATGIDLGARYLARLVTELGPELTRVAAAYNGAGRLAREVYAPRVVALADRYARVA